MFIIEPEKFYTVSSKILFDTRLKHIDVRVYILAKSFEDTDLEAFPSNGWFSNKLGASQPTIERSLLRLRVLKYITRGSGF